MIPFPAPSSGSLKPWMGRGAQTMTADLSVRQAMLDAIPRLRAFAISLSGNITYADDLVQGALLRGLENMDKFQPGTSMQAWLFTILRNQFYTDMRRRRREVEDADGAMA